MGLFDRFKKSAATKAPEAISTAIEPNTVVAPVSGEVIALENVGDPVFAGGIMGPGVGIKPSEGTVYAPVSGTISATTATWHAIGLTADDGSEVLVHVGIDTVEMGGDGFKGFVGDNAHVEAGQPLMTFDREKVAQAGYSDVIICIVTNGGDYADVQLHEPGNVQAGEKLVTLTK